MCRVIGLPEDTHDEEIENSVVQAFEIVVVNVVKHNFYAIHQLGNSKIIIANLVNRRDANKILRNKKIIRELPCSGNKSIKQRKFMLMNPCNKRLLDKCNALFK